MSTSTRATAAPTTSGTGRRRDQRCHRRRCAARARDDDADDEARRARVARATAALPIGDVVETCLRALEVRRDASNDATRDLLEVFVFARGGRDR